MEKIIIPRIYLIKRDFKIIGPLNIICRPRDSQSWCVLQYPGHPHGCPKYGKNYKDCPPQVGYFPDRFESRVYLASLRFDFGQYIKEKRIIHPDWSERRLRNSRHWQGHLKADFRRRLRPVRETQFKEYQILEVPEAMGVNVQLMCLKSGVKLEWPPNKNVYRIAILAKEKG